MPPGTGAMREVVSVRDSSRSADSVWFAPSLSDTEPVKLSRSRVGKISSDETKSKWHEVVAVAGSNTRTLPVGQTPLTRKYGLTRLPASSSTLAGMPRGEPRKAWYELPPSAKRITPVFA